MDGSFAALEDTLSDALATPGTVEPHRLDLPVLEERAQRVLAIDNDPSIVESLEHGLGAAGFEVATEISGRRALARLREESFDAALCDLRLGATSGLDILRAVRPADPRTAFLLISGIRDQQIAVEAMKEGADDFVAKPFRMSQIRERISTAVARRAAFCERLDAERALSEALRTSNEDLRRSRAEIEAHTIRTIRSLVFSLEAKDRYTKDHSIKVALLSVRIAKELGLDAREQRCVRMAGLLHDVGKIGIRESVLNKQGPLDDAEREHMRLHPRIGARILLPLTQRFPEVVASVEHEHERWDGLGYPTGLRGEDIPLAARIIAVADCFDAITSSRPYRAAQHKDIAAREIRAGAGTQFDPRVVQAFLEILPEL